MSYILLINLILSGFVFDSSTVLDIEIKNDKFDKLAIYNVGLNYEIKPIVIQENLNTKIKRVVISENIPGFFLLGDGYKGHLIFLERNDNVKFKLEKIPNIETKISQGQFTPVFSTLVVKNAKFKGDLIFFSDLDTKINAIKYKPSIDKSPSEFLDRCNKSLEISLKMLKEYQARNIVSLEFTNLAEVEILSRYILSICDILYFLPKNKMPANFFERIKHFDFANDSFAYKVPSYITACSVANIYIFNTYPVGRGYANFYNEFTSAQNRFTGVISDRLMGWVLKDYKGKIEPKFDSLLNVFSKISKDVRIRNEVLSDVAKFKKKQAQKPTFKDIIASIDVKNIHGKKIKLLSAIDSSQIVVIDIWATWCKPCLEQKTSLKLLESQYKDKVKFIYISIDKDFKEWKNFVSKKFKNDTADNHLHGQFEFENPFLKYFDVRSIPRYIVVGVDYRLISSEAPFPSEHSLFKELLDSILMEKM